MIALDRHSLGLGLSRREGDDAAVVINNVRSLGVGNRQEEERSEDDAAEHLPQPGSSRNGRRADVTAAQELQQQNHLVLAIGDAALLALIEALDLLRQLQARPEVGLFGFEGASSEKLGDVLQFV